MYDGQVVIYADILFLINFSLDYLCLFIACRLQNVYGKALRLLAASAFGGVYSFIPYIIELPIPLMLILHIGAAELICFISFGKRDLKKHLLLLGSFIAFGIMMLKLCRKGKKERAVAITLIASLLSFCACGMTDCLFYGLKLNIYMMMFFGLASAAVNIYLKKKE